MIRIVNTTGLGKDTKLLVDDVAIPGVVSVEFGRIDSETVIWATVVVIPTFDISLLPNEINVIVQAKEEPEDG